MDSFDKDFDKYKLQNIKKLFWIALGVYYAISFVDASNSQSYSILEFFLIRVFFSIPYILIYTLSHKLNKKYIDFYGLALFYSFATGISVISYLLGGVESTYYFGVLIVSFAQFLTVPLSRRGTLIYELLVIATYFSINTLPFDIDPDFLGKQISNYLSFAIIKIAVAERFRKQMMDSHATTVLNRKLKEKENLQSILGELCHLINNPLFVSNALLTKSLRKEDEESRQLIKQAIQSNNRIKEVVEEMLKVHNGQHSEFTDPETLKRYLKENQFKIAKAS